jgi:hypothetical protein
VSEDSYWHDVEARWDQAVYATNLNGSQDSVPASVSKSWNPFRAATVPVAITGAAGSGKSVLFDAIAGRIGIGGYGSDGKGGYGPPGKSGGPENHRVVTRSPRGKTRSQICVVPGQLSDPRSAAIDDLFRNGRYPTGVIYAAPWGFTTTWEPRVEDVITNFLSTPTKALSLDELREYHLNAEVSDFEDICSLLRDAWKNTAKDCWLIIAVTKTDLFWGQHKDAQAYYIPGPDPAKDSSFSQVLRDLANYLGRGNLERRLAVIPITAYPDRFTFGTHIRVDSSLDFPAVSASVNYFRSVIGEFL